MKILCINCKPDLSYFEKRGLHFDIEYATVNQLFPLQFLYNVKDQSGNFVPLYTPWAEQYLEQNYKEFKYSFIMIGWQPKDYSPVLKNSGGYTHWKALSSGTYWITVRQDPYPNNNYPIHELHHGIVDIINNNKVLNHHVIDYMDSTPVNGVMMPYYKNDFPDAPDSNYAVTWNQIKNFLPELQAITYNTMPTYKYFNPKSDPLMVGIKPEVMAVLDKVRDLSATPIKITSGLRTPAQNTAVNGSPTSAHLKGLAVDFLCTDNIKRDAFLRAIYNCGTKVFLEIAKSHIHIDLDTSIHLMGQTMVSDDD